MVSQNLSSPFLIQTTPCQHKKFSKEIFKVTSGAWELSICNNVIHLELYWAIVKQIMLMEQPYYFISVRPKLFLKFLLYSFQEEVSEEFCSSTMILFHHLSLLFTKQQPQKQISVKSQIYKIQFSLLRFLKVGVVQQLQHLHLLCILY